MKWKLLLSIALLLAVATGTMVWLMRDSQHSRTFLLADGSRLEFLEATYGANCSHDYGSPWRRLAERLPRKWAQKLSKSSAQNAIVNAGYSGDSSVVFWFVRHGGRASARATNVVYKGPLRGPTYAIGVGERRDDTFGFSLAERLRINLKDDKGEGLPGLFQFSEADLPSGDVAFYWRTHVVPSASRVVFLRVYEWRKEAGWKCIGEAEVPNPFLDAP